MAAMAGECATSGERLSLDAAHLIESSLSRFGDLGEHVHHGTSVLAVRHDISARERFESRIVVRGHVACAWEGRLDNRDDLAALLWPGPFTTDDAELALSAYVAWGAAGLAHLVGDWSIAISDAEQRSVVLARDACGGRTLYYFADGHDMLWSTSLGALVDRLRAHDDLDDEFIVSDLMGIRLYGRTPYRRIHSLTPGAALLWKPDASPQSVVLWCAPERTIRLGEVQNYAHELVRLFREALVVRLKYPGAMWAELSGGLDSSSIVCMAHSVLRTAAVAATQLETVSSYSEGLPASDERPYIATVEQHVGQTSHHLNYEDHIDAHDEHSAWVSPSVRDGVTYEMYRVVRRHNGHMLLTGDGGDPLMGNSVGQPYDVAAALQHAHIVRAMRLARTHAKFMRMTIYNVLEEAVRMLLPFDWASRGRMLRRLEVFGASRGSLRSRIANTWLIPDRYCELWIAETQAQLRLGHEYPDITKREVARYLLTCGDSTRELCEFPGVAVSRPMTHRPLIEFILGIPSEIWRPVGSPRALMRTAFASFLPARIVHRVAKGDSSPTFVRQATQAAASWLQDLDQLRVVQRGYVDRSRLRSKLELLARGGCSGVMPLPMLMRIERWLRVREEQLTIRSAAASPHRAAPECARPMPRTVIRQPDTVRG